MNIKLDEGFQFGLGAFETIAVENKNPVFLERHFRRLQKAADFLGMGEIEPTWDYRRGCLPISGRSTYWKVVL